MKLGGRCFLYKKLAKPRYIRSKKESSVENFTLTMIVDCKTNLKKWTKLLIKAKYRKMLGICIKISKKAHTKKA